VTLLLLFNQPTSVTAFLRADADDTNTDNWVDQAGSSSNLFNAIDEVSVDDADYILSPAITTGGSWTKVKIRLSNPAPGTTLGGPIKVRYRAKQTNVGNKWFAVTLYQGTTVIASWDHVVELTTSFQTFTQTLTAPQVAAITDFDDLYIRFEDVEI